MEEYLPFLGQVPLFAGIRPEDMEKMLGCLRVRRGDFHRQEILLMAGQPVTDIGIVLEGRVQIIREDFTGHRNILTELAPGSLFAESYACARAESLPVTVIAVTDCGVLWMDYRRIVGSCPADCPFHHRLIENMIAILASKNILLSRKIEHVPKRTIRAKLLAYLSDETARRGRREFDIPFNRQELADYLCVDRSALSTELGRLQREGVLRFSRSHFVLNGASGPNESGFPDGPGTRGG